jgi:hypothetical protein
MLKEKVLTSNVNLTDVQSSVLLKIFTAASPKIAHREVTTGIKDIAATKILTRLGLINIRPGRAEITDKGLKVMTDENLIDDASSEPTERGNDLLAAHPEVSESMKFSDYLAIELKDLKLSIRR